MIREKDSRLKLLLVSLVQKQRLVKVHFVLAAERNVEASRAFIVLGDVAKGAVPALAKMCDEDLAADSRSAIEDALAWIGPASKPAISVLLRGATNSNPRVRANALWALGEVHAEPELCVPVLIHALGDSNDWVRLSGAHALGMFGTEAQSAVPSLRQMTNIIGVFGSSATMGLQVNLEARNALRKIDSGVVSPSSKTVPESGFPAADWFLSPQ
jgi:HEAT repeat protein